jgi:hypothetical protein
VLQQQIVLSVPWATFRSSALGYRKGNPVGSSAPAGEVGPDLTFAWKLARNIDVRAFPAGDEQVAREALDEHPRPGQVQGLVQMLIEEVEADPARLQAVAIAARARHGELDRQGEPPQRSHSYLVAAALADRGLAMIREAAAGHAVGGGPQAEPGPAKTQGRPADGRKLVRVMRLPQIDPPFTEDQRWRDGCMMPPLTWRQRILRQVFPGRGVRDCCYYHRQDFHAIAATVNEAHRQLRRSGLDGEKADELTSRLLEHAGLSEDERTTARWLLDEVCGIQIWRPSGQRRWTYQDGRHRARALMDAGVRRILVTVTDDRRSRD